MKNKNHPVSSSSAGENIVLMRDVRVEGPDLSKLIGDSSANNQTLQQWYAEEHL